MSDKPDLSHLRPDTRAVRAGIDRSQAAEMSEGLFLTQGYVYESAEAAEAAFAGELDVFMYSRYGNPTVEAFQDRLAAVEGAEACFATATGMAAVFVSMASVLGQGDRLVTSRALFGSTINVYEQFFKKWGIQIDYVDGHRIESWEEALSTPAKVVYFESPTNPMQDVVDVRAVSELARKAGALSICDNVFATPLGQRPLELGADAVVYSATKHIDGQGRVLGGAILGSADYVNGPVKTMVRQMGATLSPFNAWVMLKGLETLGVRTRAQCATALEIAEWLEQQPGVARVLYPFLPSHAQYELARSQQTMGGTVVTLDLALPDGLDPASAQAKEAAFRFMNSLTLFELSNNFGDTKSIATHPATTTHSKLGDEGRAKVGLSHATVRLSMGLEDVEDLRDDIAKALAQI